MRKVLITIISTLLLHGIASANGFRRISGKTCAQSQSSGIQLFTAGGTNHAWVCPIWDDTDFDSSAATYVDAYGYAGDACQTAVVIKTCSQQYFGGFQGYFIHCSAPQYGTSSVGDYSIVMSPTDVADGWNFNANYVFKWLQVGLNGCNNHAVTFRGAYIQ